MDSLTLWRAQDLNFLDLFEKSPPSPPGLASLPPGGRRRIPRDDNSTREGNMKRDLRRSLGAYHCGTGTRCGAMGENSGRQSPCSECNVVLLWLARNRGWATPRFVTYKQAQEAGGHVRKGEHGTKVYFVKQLQ